MKNSWNNSNSANASSCSWTEVQAKTQFVNRLSFWKKKSLNELSKKNYPSNPFDSNYLDTNLSATYSTPNRWDNTSGKRYYSNQMISNKAICYIEPSQQ